MTRTVRTLVLGGIAFLILASTDLASVRADENHYSKNEIINEGTKFFGTVSQGLASVVEHAFSGYGLPNGYILGQEGSGAIIGGVRYGEGVLYTKNAGQHKVYWQGPSIGLDVGANGDRTMMLGSNPPPTGAVY